MILFGLSGKNRESLDKLLDGQSSPNLLFADDHDELRSLLLRRVDKN